MEAAAILNHTVGRLVRIDEVVAGGVHAGRYRGSILGGRHEGGKALISTGSNARDLSPPRIDDFRLDSIDRVSELLIAGLIDDFWLPIGAMAEREPLGKPLSEIRLPLSEQQAFRLGSDLCAIAAAAHKEGEILGGVRPEFVYVAPDDEGMVVSGVAPRWFGFRALVGPRSFWVTPPFPHCFESPELRWNEKVPATDTYMIAALVYYLVMAQSPFWGSSWATQAEVSLEEEPRSFPGSPEEIALLRAALAVRHQDRPALEELHSLFRG